MGKFLTALFLICTFPVSAKDYLEPVAIVANSRDTLGVYLANELRGTLLQSTAMKLASDSDAVFIVRLETIDPDEHRRESTQAKTAVSIAITSKIIDSKEKFEFSSVIICGSKALTTCALNIYTALALVMVKAKKDAVDELEARLKQ